MSAARAATPVPGGGDLEIVVECTSDPDERFGTVHPVVLHADWTLDTPHDLAAERVARAFGGWSSCLLFAERVVPAYRRALEAMMDPGPAHATDMAMPAAGAWTVSPERDLTSRLFARAGRAWAASGDPRQVEGGESGFFELWGHGVLPGRVDELARALPRSIWPLPPGFYLRACVGAFDIDWLVAVVECFPEREFAEWAVASGSGKYLPPLDDIRRMSALGLSARDAVGVLERRVPVARLVDVANLPGVGGPTAARWLTLWARLGLTPTSAHYRLLAERRLLLHRPAAWTLDAAARAVSGFCPEPPDRTEIAVMLALAADVGVLEDAVRRGIRTSTDPRFLERISKENPR